MRFFRGLSVAPADLERITKDIRGNGITSNVWFWRTEHLKPNAELLAKKNLSRTDTRPEGVPGTPAAYACGDLDGALHYACIHNRTADRSPVIIEFESSVENVAIDGKDFLYTVFQFGVPEKVTPLIREVFGERALMYANLAWSSDDTRTRIAICDLIVE